MTTMVNAQIAGHLPGTPLQSLAFPVDGWLAGFLIALLCIRLLLAAAASPSVRTGPRVIDVAAVPLFLAFAAIVYSRIQEILPLG
jgi:hypothetical protein